MVTSNNLFSLEGKTALITGATGFLGKVMAYALAEAGAHILVNSRNYDKANDLVEALLEEGYSAETLVFDITDEREVESIKGKLSNKPLHILINNAYSGVAGSISTAEAIQYRESYEVTIVAAHNLLRALLPSLRLGVKQNGDASVINIASMYGMVSPDFKNYDSLAESNPPFYGASKAALIQWSRYAACEFGPLGIRVNSISPGPFPNDTVKQNAPDFVERLESRVPLGRVGLAEEVQGPVLFLASPAASYVNGANLVVDGGWTAW
jgi:NAD(P)-dependent dehydrogenase (short-subunit alcohol dehydrogenase family)